MKTSTLGSSIGIPSLDQMGCIKVYKEDCKKECFNNKKVSNFNKNKKHSILEWIIVGVSHQNEPFINIF